MVRTEMSIGVKRVISAVQKSAFLVLAIVSVGWGMERTDDVKTARCDFSTYLEVPANRAKYEATLDKARTAYAPEKNYSRDGMYGEIVDVSFSSGNKANLDSFSAGCLTCHDGVAAPDVSPRIRNNPTSKTRMQSIYGKHPIGMDYEKYAGVRHDLKGLDELKQKIVLVEGKVSCITCHDPLNSEKNHLTMSNSENDLCFACHKV